jgi:hypothetical protein
MLRQAFLSGVAVTALILAASGPAAAVTLTFDDHVFGGTAGGTISHVAGGVVSGSDINIFGVEATGAPTNNGPSNALRCEGCSFSFTSGALTNEGAADGTPWTWGAGGTFSLVGTMFDTNGTPLIFGDDVAVTGADVVLLSGSFASMSATGTIQAQGNHLNVTGFGIDTKDADMLAYFGLPADIVWEFSNSHLNAGTATFGADGSFSGTVTNTDLNNFALLVPEPATMTLFGIGLVGLGLMSRRRQRA